MTTLPRYTGLMQRLYTFVIYLITPVILTRLAWRGLRAPDYLHRWKERFGHIPLAPGKGGIWVHAVSLGEVNAAAPLIRSLQDRFPERIIVLTTVTPTGSSRVRQLFGESVFHVYLPYDLPSAVGRFLDRVDPSMAVIMETEIWPNLYCICHRREIPLFIANARLSERSEVGYGPVISLVKLALSCVWGVAAQSHSDAARLIHVGVAADHVDVVGSLKFDANLPKGLIREGKQLRSTLGRRPVWVAASTHDGEEVATLQAAKAVLGVFPDALLLLVPRHPERFGKAAALCRAHGLKTVLRSEVDSVDDSVQCFVVDTMGELMKFYAAADVAFVGGSIAPIGGHNVLEPAALGTPVIVGPNTFNFAEVTQLLVSRGAARRVAGEAELSECLLHLLGDASLRKAMGEECRAIIAEQKGVVDKILAMIEHRIAAGRQPNALQTGE